MADRFPSRAWCEGCRRERPVRANGEFMKHRCQGVQFGPVPAPLYDRVMRHVRRTRGGHLIWLGTMMNGVPAIACGPRLSDNGMRTNTTVRRVIWRHCTGEDPASTVRVTCGHPKCVALEHMDVKAPEDPAVREERDRRRAEKRARVAARSAAIVEDYRAGMRLVDIKARHDVEASEVYRQLRAAGIEPDRGGGRYDRSRYRTEVHASV